MMVALRTLSDLAHLPKVRFPPENKIQFWMDFASWEGIPSDRDFYIDGVVGNHNSVQLVARGYGIQGDYGNGSIMVSNSDLFARA